jgi:hypothetical protein
MRSAARRYFPFLQAAGLFGMLLLPGFVQGDELYYMLMFGAQRPVSQPKHVHTFATFVKATGTGPDLSVYQTECHTASWIAASFRLKTLALYAEPGTALDLDATLQWARCEHLDVSMWGPFQIKKELYDRAVAHIAFLQGGGLGYKLLDHRFRPCEAVDCIHALSDIDQDRGLLETGTACGDRASYLVLLHLKRWIIDPCQTQDWILDHVCPGNCPISRRGWEGSRHLRYHESVCCPTSPPCPAR